MIKVIKKDGTKEEFNVQKVVVAVNKSAYRALVTFTEEELDFICNFVTEKVEQMRKKEVTISDMHNVVEGALEQTNPLVAKSYRDYRNYKQDFVQMLDDVYKKSQSIMYIGDKENSNTDSALVSTKRSLIFAVLLPYFSAEFSRYSKIFLIYCSLITTFPPKMCFLLPGYLCVLFHIVHSSLLLYHDFKCKSITSNILPT